MKRSDYLSWDEYFMGIALLSSKRSKDPHTQVGACIVGEDNRILSLGYNGMPMGCSDDQMPWGKAENPLEAKYLFVCHAELNAILNTRQSCKNAKLYTTLFPCNECAKAIIQSGIRSIIYLENLYADSAQVRASQKMFHTVGITCRAYHPKNRNITLSL